MTCSHSSLATSLFLITDHCLLITCSLPTPMSHFHLLQTPFPVNLHMRLLLLFRLLFLKGTQGSTCVLFLFPTRLTAVSGESAKDARLPTRSPEKECIR
jgi:hypothetical protein